MTSTTLRRAAAVSVGAALALAGLTTTPAEADATPSSYSAAYWLGTQLTGGVVHNDQYNFDDYGLTVDVGLALAVAGDPAGAFQSVSSAMATHVHDYTEPGFGTDISAGGTAKVLRLAQVSGADARSYGGVDLVARMEALTGATGRIADDVTTPSDPDYANTIGQAFAVEGLGTAGSPEAATATGFLLAQQCTAGWFRLGFSPAGAADQSCNGASPAATPDTDVTALAVLALQSRRADPGVDAAIARAVAWLSSAQLADGSFGGGTSTDAPNTNSTGLAAAALGSSCATAAAQRAADWVRGLQVPVVQTGPLGASIGAIAYDPAAKALGQTNGITTDTADQWRRATAQAALGLVWDASATPTVQVSTPTGYVKGGKVAAVTISGVAAGERVCVTDSTGKTATLTGTGAALSYPVTTAKKGAAEITVTATTGPGVASSVVKVLGKAKLKAKVAKSVAQGDRVRVKVKRLGAKEKVKVLVDGTRVLKGKANRKGVFKARFVARLKPGTHTLKVVGQFKRRVGRTTFTVLR